MKPKFSLSPLDFEIPESELEDDVLPSLSYLRSTVLPENEHTRVAFAMLVRALMDLSAKNRELDVLVDTLVWLRRDDEKYLFSFVRCCYALGFDPKAIRERFLAMAEDGERIALKRRLHHWRNRNKTTAGL